MMTQKIKHKRQQRSTNVFGKNFEQIELKMFELLFFTFQMPEKKKFYWQKNVFFIDNNSRIEWKK